MKQNLKEIGMTTINNYQFKQVRSMIDNDTPFIMMKYTVTFVGIQGVVYELIRFNKYKQIVSTVIDKDTFVQIVNHFELPELHRIDANNAIWGDERFKEMYNENRKLK